ncbi:MAG: hypothetical protein LCH79_15215 [Proteobacteria bacterium]|nr:hypothetical protein [Pseudomonadota bacterium]
MTTSTENLTDEDQMAAALSEIRSARAEDPATAATSDATQSAAAPAAADAATTKDKTVTADDKKPEATPAADKAAEETPEQRLAKAQAELHRVTSEIGRVNALNQKAARLEREKADLQLQLQEAKTPPKTAEEAKDRFADLAEQVKEFPELTRILKVVGDALTEVEGKVHSTAKAAAQEVVEPLKPLADERQDRITQEQAAAEQAASEALLAVYPMDTVKAVVKTDDFKSWISKQSSALQFAFHKGQSALDAKAVLDSYDADLRRAGKPSIAVTKTESAAGAGAETTGKAGEPTKKDTSRLERAAGLPSRTSSAASRGALPAEDDFDGSLAHFRAQRLARQRAAPPL